MGHPIKYTDEMVAAALAMRADGQKQSVIYLTFGPGIEMAIRRVRERDAGPELLARVMNIGQKMLKRKKDGQIYRIHMADGRKMASRSAAYLVPVWGGRSHWKTHEKILTDYEVMEC